MRGMKTLTLTSFKMYLREPIGTFFTLAYPIMLVLIFGTMYGNTPVDMFGGYGTMDISMPGYTALILATVGFVSVPITIANYRETGVLRRLRATPMRPFTFIASDLVTNIAMTLLGMLGVVLLGWLIYQVRFEGQVIPLILGVIFCGLAMDSFGYLIASLAPTARAAQIIGMVVLFPMMFMSGSGMPLEILPESIQRISTFLPLTYVVRLLRALWFGQEWSVMWPSVLFLGIFMIVCGSLAARFFRWE